VEGKVVATCISERKGTPKTPVAHLKLVRGLGIEGDAHAGDWHRQVSLLEEERIAEMRARGPLTLAPGAFAENLVTAGISLSDLALGRRFRIGEHAVLQVTQHGKECHTPCVIARTAGECIMPVYGLFARVVRGGEARPGDRIFIDPAFDRFRYAVVTLSDKGSAGIRKDASGPLIVELLQAAVPGDVVAQNLLPDDRDALRDLLVDLCDEQVCDLVITTGGTGLSPRDITPEVTRGVADRDVPGIAEAIRAAGMKHTPRAMLSRGTCVQRGHTLILNLSGSPKAVREQLSVVLPVLAHALETATGIPQECGTPGQGGHDKA
jgi:molybdenum cofactor synthesis domain-containing protein